MILVLLYHCLCGYSNIWGDEYSWKPIWLWSNISHALVYFHIPIFTMMSAYIYAYLNSEHRYEQTYSFLIKKTKRLLIPYIIWGISICIIQKYEFKYLLYGISHLWYLLFIFEAFILFHFIQLISHWYKYIILILSYTIICIIQYVYPTPYFGLEHFIKYMPYFVIGYHLYFWLEKVRVKSSSLYIAAIIGLSSFILEYITMHNRLILAGLGLIIIICAIALCKQKESKLMYKEKLLKLDKYMMGIYIIHHIIIQEMNRSSIGQLYMRHDIIYPLFQLIFCFCMSLFITYCLQKTRIGKYLV